MSGKTKGLLGCGGCGCLMAIVLFVCSFVLTPILGKVLPDTIATFSALGFRISGGLSCLLGGLLLIVGIVFMMKDKKAAAEDDE